MVMARGRSTLDLVRRALVSDSPDSRGRPMPDAVATGRLAILARASSPAPCSETMRRSFSSARSAKASTRRMPSPPACSA